MSAFKPAEPSQSLFRVLLTALSHPGQVFSPFITCIDAREQGLLLETVLCLLDHEVTFALAEPGNGELATEIAQLTGASQTSVDQADFLIVEGNQSNGQVNHAKRGTLTYPDQGATVIYSVSDIDYANTEMDMHHDVILSGPGIQNPLYPQMEGLVKEEFIHLRQVNEDYPLGVDAFFIKRNSQIMGLPRSTHIEVR